MQWININDVFQLLIMTIRKQPFSDVLQNRCSSKFGNIHRKTPELKSLFNIFQFFSKTLGSYFQRFFNGCFSSACFMCLVDKDVLIKEKMLRNWTKWNEVASFLVNYFQHLFKVHRGCFWYWEIKVFSEITKKI